MPKASKPAYYAVRIGRVPGIYLSWADCEAQLKGFTGAFYKKLSTEAEANEFMAAKPSAARTSTSRDVVPVASSSRAPAVPGLNNAHTRAVEVTAEDEKDCDIVYCDGACKGNGQPGSIAGIGVWWGHGDPRNISERCPGDQTNNRAELIAIVRILETAPRLKRRLLIKTDSKYSIQCVTSWIFKWMSNGFLAADGKPVKNRALIKYIAALLHARRKMSQTVEFKHVRGHVGIEGNEAADQLANLGAIKPNVPERDWQKLENEVLKSLKPVIPVKVVDDDLKAYADGLLNDDELAELADTSINNVIVPVREPRRQENGKNAIRSHTSVSPVPHDVSPRRVNATGSRPNDGTTAVRTRSKLPSRGSSGPTAAAAQGLQSTPSKKPTTTISKEELEVFASCLLGNEESSVSPVPYDISPPRVNAAGSRPNDGTTAVRIRSKLPSRGSSGPTAAVATRGLQLTPSKKKPTTAISKGELEQFASCLLGDGELSAFGKDGVFDSDF